MRRQFSVLGLLAIALPALAVIVDRSAVTVGGQVITDSEITRHIRLAAFQNGNLPDFGPASRREMAQRLIDLRLVEHEMDLGNYVRTSPARAAELLKAFIDEHFHSSAEALRLSLAELRLTPTDLRNELAEQADLLLFTSLRFRPAVEISDKQIEDYYRAHIATQTSPKPLSLADAHDNIEQILVNHQADLDLDAWLQDRRQNTRITYLEKELQ